MNKYLLRLLSKKKSERYHMPYSFSKTQSKTKSSLYKPCEYNKLLRKGTAINQKIIKRLKSYSHSISNGNGLNGNGHTRHKDPEIQKIQQEIDKAELLLEKAYKEFKEAEIKSRKLRVLLYNGLDIEDDYYMFNLDFLRSIRLTDKLYNAILNYNNSVIEEIYKYKKYVMALIRYETALAEYAMRTEGIRPEDQKRWEIKMAYREAEIQYADATIELRYELGNLLKAIKRLLEAEHRFTITKSKLEKLDVIDENVSQLQDEAIAAFYEYQDRLKDYYNARKRVSEKVREYKEARITYEIMQEKYEELLRDIMAN